MRIFSPVVRPWLVGVVCFVAGAVVVSIPWYKAWEFATYDPLAGYVNEYTHLLDRVDLPPQADGDLASFVWGSTVTVAGFAGAQYDHMSSFWREQLVRDVTRIDQLAPQFENVSFNKNFAGFYTIEQSTAIRQCILAVKVNTNADVQTCVREIKAEALKGRMDGQPQAL